MRYVCPNCRAISREGLAIGGGPWCGKCGTEMKIDRRSASAKGTQQRRPKDTPIGLEAV